MKIEFPKKETMNSDSGGVNFPAIVDGSQIICLISREALQDIAPENSTDTVNKQFRENRTAFENIARSKIEDGDIDTEFGTALYITTASLARSSKLYN